jgi:hypothetical protein
MGRRQPAGGGSKSSQASHQETVAPSRVKIREFEGPRPSGTLTTTEFRAAVLQGYFKNIEISYFPDIPRVKPAAYITHGISLQISF